METEDPDGLTKKLKTVPCRFYHSHVGCGHGDTCDFIHDPSYAGVSTPHMDKYVKPTYALSKRTDQNLVNYMLL